MGPGSGSYSQNFNGLGDTSLTWVDNSTIPGWYAQRTSAWTTFTASDGFENSGDLYNYGSTDSTDRSLGSLGTGGAGHFAWGIRLQNNSGASGRDAINISYAGEQWRFGAVGSQTVSFYYKRSMEADSVLQPNNNGTWTAVTALNFSSPIITGSPRMLDGNGTDNRVLISGTITFSPALADGEYILLKWDDPDHGGADHGFSIDDVSIGWSDASPLSISLSTFSAKKVNTHNLLQWTTESEINNLYFEIETAEWENGFKSIGKINGAVNSQSKKDYSFIDVSPLEGINYYRLKQVDLDGSFTYSKIISVFFSSQNKVQIFPNPVSNELKIIFNKETQDKFGKYSSAGSQDRIGIHLFDYTGKFIKTWKAEMVTGEISLDINEIARGVYILELGFENQVEKYKIVKL